ncbi:hypothetical protein B7494_g7392 [Chlorociboria aeruginascens]|nr:hypothetical protein B7494_g7392 [Chlorociboria aeruginascens]
MQTSRLAFEFHSNVASKAPEPSPPEYYRDKSFPVSTDYLLLHKEEQHLADNLAFLSQAEGGAFYVSAVTREECRTPPSLTVQEMRSNLSVQNSRSATLKSLHNCLGILLQSLKDLDDNSDEDEIDLLKGVILKSDELAPPQFNHSLERYLQQQGFYQSLSITDRRSVFEIDKISSGILSTTMTFCPYDLPIIKIIRPSTISCILLVAKVSYIFYLGEVEDGQLVITADEKAISDDLQIFDVRKLSANSPTVVRNDNKHPSLQFQVHDARDYGLQITVMWND